MQVQLTVVYPLLVPPTYSLNPDYLQAVAGTSPTVHFTVTSCPPLVEVKHTLKRGGRPTTKRFKVEENQITFQNVREADSGEYVISCCNDDGEEGEESLELEVIGDETTGTASSTCGSVAGHQQPTGK